MRPAATKVRSLAIAFSISGSEMYQGAARSQYGDDEFEQPVFHSASPMVFHLSIKFIVTAGNTNDGGLFFQLLLRFREHDS